MTQHEEPADRPERELEDMEQQGERLESRIEGARQDWEAKKRDPSVSGATGAPAPADAGEVDDPPPEQESPARDN